MADTAPLSTMASGMMFGTITFAAAALACRSFLSGDIRAYRKAQNPRSSPLDVRCFSSIYTLLHHMTVFGLILLYGYICEYHPPFPHANKSYDRDEFFFLTALLIFASAWTVSKNDRSAPTKTEQKEKSNGHYVERTVAEVNDANEVLNRNQTEEWKGWMQYMFLLYHYFHAEEVYNSIRIMITCYVWMTGFGNFSFFYLKGDFSAVRVMQMLWRLNFLVLFLCLTQGTTYILYYICLLHTYFFLMVYVIMWTGKSVNYSKWGLRVKMAVAAVAIFLIWDVDSGLFRLIHFPFLGDTPVLGATSGTMWEWYFRSSLDHWSTFFGMIFALNFPITSLFFRKLEAQPFLQHFLGKSIVALGLLAAFFFWVTGPFQQEKFEYNATNAYFGFVPLITYIYFRNLTPTLRSYSLDLLHQIGKTTLETYLMQHHIWLTSDAKSLLTLIPGWPKVNMLLVTIIYYLISRRLYQLTLFLRGMVLPDDRNKCFRNVAAMGLFIGAFYTLAIFLKMVGFLSLASVAAVSVAFGMLLYRIIMETTWKAYHESAVSNPTALSGSSLTESLVMNVIGKHKYSSSFASLSPPMAGALIVLILGLTWNGMSELGSSKIQTLPAACEAFVNDGIWVPVNGCNEESRGAAYRDYGISSYATCGTNTYVFGWNATTASTHCRFVHRDAANLRKTLKHRTITYVGDSEIRNIYHATMRALGMADAGAYNTKIEKWSDITNTVDDAVVEFKWAAYATDQVAALTDIIARPLVAQNEAGSVRPDIVVMGGGAWDRLHVYATDEERVKHREKVKELAALISKARNAFGIPVVWMVPTTINTNALATEEKQENIKESDIQEIREVYASQGVLEASSFVLDGPGFTASRVSESYDGVHYPNSVYDAAAQIMANAMDWILPLRQSPDVFKPPQPGQMAQPLLGTMALCFVFMGLFFFDGFMGFSYLASIFVKGVRPADLYAEAFSSLHQRKNLPEIASPAVPSFGTSDPTLWTRGTQLSSVKRKCSDATTVDEESVSLVGTGELEMPVDT